MKGAIIEKGEPYFTNIKNIFDSLGNIQRNYNWLITDYECYPQNEEYKILFSEPYIFIDGIKLSEIVFHENFQWIWGVLSGFKKSISINDILKYPLPVADGNENIWKNPINIQNPLADIEIIAWDSRATVLFSRNDWVVEKFKNSYSMAVDMYRYNDMIKF